MAQLHLLRGTTALAILATVASIGAYAQPARRIDPSRLIADVEALTAPTMEGRRTGTPGNQRAQAFIIGRFRDLRLKPIGARFEQPFSFQLRGGGSTSGTNLVGAVRGTTRPDDFLLLTAHYDHLGVTNGAVHPGADDNASGVASLLQAAAHVAAHPLQHTVVFVAFDGEEQGLQGAKHFVATPPIELKRIRLMINLDMVSRNDASIIFASGTSHHPALKEIVTRAAQGRRLTVKFGHDRPAKEAGGEEDWTQQSDHGPFHTAGVRTLYYGVEDHADYHKPTDTADRIPRAFFAEVAELVIQTLIEADRT
jgi:Zn-dependent M28 family amino/carboxypeptidase